MILRRRKKEKTKSPNSERLVYCIESAHYSFLRIVLDLIRFMQYALLLAGAGKKKRNKHIIKRRVFGRPRKPIERIIIICIPI